MTFFDHIQRDRGVAQETTRPRNVGVRSAIEGITDNSGQIIPTDAEVTVEAVITSIDDERKLLKADGFLHVDGRTIYGMKDFSLRVV